MIRLNVMITAPDNSKYRLDMAPPEIVGDWLRGLQPVLAGYTFPGAPAEFVVRIETREWADR